MKMWIVTTLLVAIVTTEVGEFFKEDERVCEPCTECNDFLYERESCSQFKDAVCGWCGSKKPVKNLDYYRKCPKHHVTFDEKKFEREFRMRVMSKILRDEGKRVSDEVIDIDELPDARRLPPLPTDDDYDEYYDDEILGTLNHDEMPASEEELQGKWVKWVAPTSCYRMLLCRCPSFRNGRRRASGIIWSSVEFILHAIKASSRLQEIVDSYQVQRLKLFDDAYDAEEEKPKKRDFAPISGGEFLRNKEPALNEEQIEKELEEDGVQPVSVNEAKIDEESDSVGEADELLDISGSRINIVAIAERKKARTSAEEGEEEDDYSSSSNYATVCHTARHVGLYIYALCFIILAAIILKR
ncbi:hypothetical protein Y032_0229g2903 [Ancylostoma ceylanicum]|nr:hypothetical protein Y032_0229g2903 [Ancylostoma ceylanicum]